MMLLNTLPCTRQPHTTSNQLVQNTNAVEKSHLKQKKKSWMIYYGYDFCSDSTQNSNQLKHFVGKVLCQDQIQLQITRTQQLTELPYQDVDFVILVCKAQSSMHPGAGWRNGQRIKIGGSRGQTPTSFQRRFLAGGKESVCNAGDPGSIPGWGIEGRLSGLENLENGNPLQYSCLENSMDRGAWRAIVHGVEKSRNN